ncbi:MAG: AAA family ATPase [Bacteroidales bacterium]|nr:AAA family ATPase [Lachnoclostridium sp.]MCM1385366.1 AAA family ATPase [Lachnoclostridium sp.]MCM1466196.1 AAA family ATPase [Bacteroidales bacterium]
MRILSCHIENFGKFHDYSINFAQGVNTLCEENGWGKSTLAAFIQAMFYGFEGERKRSLEENERKRYMPWQGGVFGGQIVFETQGKVYQISRIFRDKEAKDEFEIRDVKTNLLSKEYSSRIGEEIFRINKESFQRTVFIGQKECETSATDDINAKIGNLADNSNDLNNFEAANARLTEIINKLNPDRASGSLAKRKEEIAGCQRLVVGGEGISDSINQCQQYLRKQEDTLRDLKNKMQETKEQQTKVSAMQSVLVKKSEWDRLKKDITAKKETEEKLKNQFPKGIPLSEEIKETIQKCRETEKLQERVQLYRISAEEEAELSALEASFEKGAPSVESIQEKLREAEELRAISQEYRAEQISSAERERLKELEPYFDEESENITAIVANWNQRNLKKAALPSNRAALTAWQASAEAKASVDAKRNLLLIFGLLLGVTGAVLTAVVSLTVGLPLLAAGVILAVCGWLFAQRQTAPSPFSPEMESLQQMIAEDMEFMERTDKETANYLAAHGKVFDENTVSALLQEITEEAVEYFALKKKCQRAEESKKAKNLDILRKSLETFLEAYGMVSTELKFVDSLYELKAKAERYDILQEKRENFRKAQDEYAGIERSVLAFLEQYGYSPDEELSPQINNIQNLADSCQNAASALTDAREELARFEEENDISLLREMSLLSERQDGEELPGPEELSRRMQQLTEEMEKVQDIIRDYNSRLENLQKEYDDWEENGIRLEELKTLQEKEQQKHWYIVQARLKLGLAKEAMTAKYADPILQGFRKYYEMIVQSVADHFHVDAHGVITANEYGKQRDTVVFSAGYRDLIGICLRIAFVDAMYREEAPILIMDDPFANLDDRKMAACKDFLEALSEKYQILYFTCSHAREFV